MFKKFIYKTPEGYAIFKMTTNFLLKLFCFGTIVSIMIGIFFGILRVMSHSPLIGVTLLALILLCWVAIINLDNICNSYLGHKNNWKNMNRKEKEQE